MINREDLNTPMYGTGGMNYCEEWEWSGNYYMYLYRDGTKLNHNYYIQFWRNGTIRKTIGWSGSVHLALTASNSHDIHVCRFRERSLKKCNNLLIKRNTKI
jgi:hypothetical protein